MAGLGVQLFIQRGPLDLLIFVCVVSLSLVLFLAALGLGLGLMERLYYCVARTHELKPPDAGKAVELLRDKIPIQTT